LGGFKWLLSFANESYFSVESRRKSAIPIYLWKSTTFAQDIALLVRSLGGLCSLTPLREDPTITQWLLQIDLPTTTYHPKVRLTKISFKRRAQAQCISVSHPSHTYLTDDYVVTHNTSFAMNIAENVAIKEGLPVLVFSMEMGAAQLATRMLGSVGRVNQGRLRTGNLNDEGVASLYRCNWSTQQSSYVD
jgi:replicative DNA helicase